MCKKTLTIYYVDKVDPPADYIDHRNHGHEVQFKYATKTVDEKQVIEICVDMGIHGVIFPVKFDADEYIPPHRIEKIVIKDA